MYRREGFWVCGVLQIDWSCYRQQRVILITLILNCSCNGLFQQGRCLSRSQVPLIVGVIRYVIDSVGSVSHSPIYVCAFYPLVQSTVRFSPMEGNGAQLEHFSCVDVHGCCTLSSKQLPCTSLN